MPCKSGFVGKFFQSFYNRETAYYRNGKQENVIHECYFVLKTNKVVTTEAEYCFEECTELVKVFKVENSETDNYNELIVYLPYYNRDFFHFLFAYEHFEEYENSVVDTPDNEVPVCAVPYAGTEPYEEKSAILATFAENRHIEQIITEECA